MPFFQTVPSHWEGFLFRIYRGIEKKMAGRCGEDQLLTKEIAPDRIRVAASSQQRFGFDNIADRACGEQA